MVYGVERGRVSGRGGVNGGRWGDFFSGSGPLVML